MVLGNQPKIMQMFTLVPMKTIKKVDMDDMCGLMDVFMKETLLKMLSNLLFYFRHGKGRLIYTDGR